MTDNANFSAFFLDDEPVGVDIDLPTGEPMLYEGARVRAHIYGVAGARHIKAKDVVQRESTKRVVNAMSTNAKKEKEDADTDIKFLVAITERIENFPFPGGLDAIYREPKLMYIAEQVRTASTNQALFFKGSATP